MNKNPITAALTNEQRTALNTAIMMLVERDMKIYAEALRALLTSPRAAVPGAAKLPDGSGFMVASLPLPADHWLYAPRGEWNDERDTYAETPHPILTHAQRDQVVAAVRYAVRGATMCGKESDFDPDALVQNAVYALCGPRGFDLAAAPAAPEQP
ncbi:hypothetical protein [Burkholderia plantarii]|uniref:hypothetical protein n=1 Tax=Burkholderia plantarii TaxID=41899 RepID=UPI00114CE85D|nr:hypothetical protein [Burkholderia plantarii]